MQQKHAAILGSLIISFLIMVLSVQLSSHNLYFVSDVEANIAKNEMEYTLPLNSISYAKLSKQDKKQVDCLAKNIYYEAAYEPMNGWIGVASVTMNRLLSGNYADSVCGVVYQKTGHAYQFSWVGMKNRLSKIDEELYNNILKVATAMYVGYDSSKDVTKGATFYHADYVNPRWKLEKTKKIGRHIFYRSPKDNIGEEI